MEYKLPVYGQWEQFTDADIAKLRKSGKNKDADDLEHMITAYEQNPLSFFRPHGIPWCNQVRERAEGRVIFPLSEYSSKYENDGAAFLNDWTNDVVMLLAPNQTGKTVLGTIFTALRVIKCEQHWSIFQDNHVQFHEWRGPKIWIVASYSWDNVTTVWNRYKTFLPRSELLRYSPQWGKYENERGSQKELNFGDGRPKSIQLGGGSKIVFLCYTQQQMHWEGFESDGLHADEQIPKEKFIGWSRSTTTRGDYTPVCMTMTGHVLPDRPDTGAGGWLKHQMWDGYDTTGKSIGRYHLSIDSTPEVIIGKKKRKQLYDQWANPDKLRNEKDARAAVARYWGGWEEGSGLVFDEWDRNTHVIPPLWKDDKTPRDWTKWRVIDYGDNGVTCCSWWAVSPKQFAICYRILYERGMLISEVAKEVIHRSHNEQVDTGTKVREKTGLVYSIFKEEQIGEVFYNSLLDSRSAAQDHQGPTLLELFSYYGLELTPACGQKNVIQIPRFKDWLAIDRSKPHITRKNKDGTPYMGAPRVYFFEGQTEYGVIEIESLERDKNDPSKIAARQDDHFCDTAKYWASDSPAYYGDIYADDDSIVDLVGREKTPYTNY